MSIPALARHDDDGDRFYTFGDPPERFYSITTIIGGGVPKWLHPWYAKMTAELVYADVSSRGPHARAHALLRRWERAGRADFLDRQSRGELKSVKLAKQTGRDLGLRWLKGAAPRSRDEAAERGTDVHDKAEQLVLDHAAESIALTLAGLEVTAWPEALAGYESAFRGWIEDFHPIFLATEATVINRTQAYAGTLDAIAVFRVGDLQRHALAHHKVIFDGFHPDTPVKAVIDYKSGNRLYATVGMQLAALARGEFIAHPLGRIELPMIEVEIGAVLHLTPKGYQFKLVRIDDGMFEAFAFAREVYRFLKETAPTVFIADLTPTTAHEEVA